jgi:hypothetical protein
VQRVHDLVVDDADTTRGDGAHRELGLLRGAELADDKNIERRAECLCNLIRNWNAAAGKRENNDLLAGTLFTNELTELLSQPQAGVDAIGKQGGLPPAAEIML